MNKQVLPLKIGQKCGSSQITLGQHVRHYFVEPQACTDCVDEGLGFADCVVQDVSEDLAVCDSSSNQQLMWDCSEQDEAISGKCFYIFRDCQKDIPSTGSAGEGMVAGVLQVDAMQV